MKLFKTIRLMNRIEHVDINVKPYYYNGRSIEKVFEMPIEITYSLKDRKETFYIEKIIKNKSEFEIAKRFLSFKKNERKALRTIYKLIYKDIENLEKKDTIEKAKQLMNK